MTDNLRALALAAQATQSSPNYHEHERAFEYAATPDAVLSLCDEIDRLKAEIADHERAYELLFKECGELRKDAERYQFLRGDFSPMGLNIDGNHAWAYRRNATLKGPSLDAAIDAAKGESHE
jgi:hypothetical protein